MLRHGGSDVRIAVLSMSSRSANGDDARYLEWHGLDHQPEQHRIAALRSGARWVSTPTCMAARAASVPPYDQVDHVVCYLFADPVETALESFFALGADLRESGRMPLRLPMVELGGYQLAGKAAARTARVGCDVLPWRPARGVYLLVEQGPAQSSHDLLDVEGVAGLWSYEGTASLHERLAPTGDRTLTLVYLDDDPMAVADRLDEVLAARWQDGSVAPLLAAPFLTVVPYSWDAALPG